MVSVISAGDFYHCVYCMSHHRADMDTCPVIDDVVRRAEKAERERDEALLARDEARREAEQWRWRWRDDIERAHGIRPGRVPLPWEREEGKDE